MSNWSEKVIALEAAGWSQSDIAVEVGISPQSISDIKAKRTVEPRGMAAVGLHALHARVCGADPEKKKAA